MSFARKVKQELVRLKCRNKIAMRAQLAGITHASGTLKLGRALGLEYITETHQVGRQIASFASSLYGIQAILSLRKAEHRRLKLTAVTLMGEQVETLLADAGLFERNGSEVTLLQELPSYLQEQNAYKRVFLRGAFLGAGYLSNPKRSYHLEIVCQNDWLAQVICQMLEELQCPAKTVRRKERTVVYLKEGDRISAFLALLGASNATLAFEDTRAEKELRNYINRTSNCETANIGKTVYAAGEQLDAIRMVMQRNAWDRLSPVLRETAELRLHNPEASLQELADLAGIGKSGMNHRLQRLIKFAGELI